MISRTSAQFRVPAETVSLGDGLYLPSGAYDGGVEWTDANGQQDRGIGRAWIAVSGDALGLSDPTSTVTIRINIDITGYLARNEVTLA